MWSVVIGSKRYDDQGIPGQFREGLDENPYGASKFVLGRFFLKF